MDSQNQYRNWVFLIPIEIWRISGPKYLLKCQELQQGHQPVVNWRFLSTENLICFCWFVFVHIYTYVHMCIYIVYTHVYMHVCNNFQLPILKIKIFTTDDPETHVNVNVTLYWKSTKLLLFFLITYIYITFLQISVNRKSAVT